MLASLFMLRGRICWDWERCIPVMEVKYLYSKHVHLFPSFSPFPLLFFSFPSFLFFLFFSFFSLELQHQKIAHAGDVFVLELTKTCPLNVFAICEDVPGGQEALQLWIQIYDDWIQNRVKWWVRLTMGLVRIQISLNTKSITLQINHDGLSSLLQILHNYSY